MFTDILIYFLLQQFFVFVDNALNKSQPLSLSNAQIMENLINIFIMESQKEIELDHMPAFSIDVGENSFASEEEAAMHHGKYTTSMSSVDLTCSKSILNRHSLSMPLEKSCRTSREAATLHMPIYTETKLILPSFLPPNVREVSLPFIFNGEAKKKRQALVALAACVRLHKLGLLNDRLLPLSSSDMKEWLLKKSLIDLPLCKHQQQKGFEAPYTVYVYSIFQSGDRFNAEQSEVLEEGTIGMQLAIISLILLPDRKSVV